MDLDGLRAFVAVVDAASFSAAADRLRLTQPAVSKRMASLEAELGVRLLDRMGKRIELTEAGRVLLPRARRILTDIEDSQRLLSALSTSVQGDLHLAASHHIGLHYLPRILRRFQQCYPEVTLDLNFMDSDSAAHGVAHGDIELAIITLPTTPQPALAALPVWPDPLAYVCHREHPLTAVLAPDLHTLSAYPAILPAANTSTRQRLEAVFAEAGLALRIGLETNYLETIKSMVITGLGWSVLPRTLLDERLHVLAVEPALTRELGLVHHRERTLSNAARAMLEVCRAA